MLGNKAVAIKFTLHVFSVTAAWFLLWLYPSCCQKKKKSYLRSLLNIQRAGISIWQMLLFTWRLDFFFFLFFFTYTLIKFTCRDRLNFLILKLLKFVNQILLWSKERVHEVVTFFWKIKDFIMEESQRAHLALSFLSYKQQLEFITTLHIEVWVGMPLVVIYSLFFLVFFLYQ